MIKETDEVDFDLVLQDEKKRKAEAEVQRHRDEEVAKKLLEEEMLQNEEDMLYRVLRESLSEF